MAERSDDKRVLRPPKETPDLEHFPVEARNQITVISARVQLLRRRIQSGSLELDELGRALTQIELAVNRLASLLKQFDDPA